MIRERLKDNILSILPELAKKFGQKVPPRGSFLIGKPKNSEHGDFAIDWAFQLAKVFKTSPWNVAQEICTLMQQVDRFKKITNVEYLEYDVSAVKTGFVNFKISDHTWRSVIRHIKDNDIMYGASSEGKGERVILEYVSANPTGPLTIAHGRQACIGDTLAHVLKKSGYEVLREYYLNDGGRQINLLGESTRARYLEILGITTAFPEEGYQGDYIRTIAEAIVTADGDKYKNSSLADALPFFSTAAMNYLMRHIKEDLHAIGVSFDSYVSEQSLQGKKIEAVLATLEKEGYLFEEDGALWFASQKFGDDKDRVLRKSSGDFTYLVPDIAYHRDKFTRGFTRAINLLGPDHHGYVKRLKAAVSAVGYNADALEILIVQLTTLYKQGEPFRMSTRAGAFISLRQLIDEVGADATRFFFLMRRISSHLDFDLDLAKEKSQDNPVFYLQYAHARIASIIKYAEREVNVDVDLTQIKEVDEFALIKLLNEFPYQIAQTARILEPYRLVDYLKEVATLFHRFYAHHRVVTQDEELTKARLLLCDAVRIVIRNGLELLGVSHPDEM